MNQLPDLRQVGLSFLIAKHSVFEIFVFGLEILRFGYRRWNG
jgi:hypothetical protein